MFWEGEVCQKLAIFGKPGFLRTRSIREAICWWQNIWFAPTRKRTWDSQRIDFETHELICGVIFRKKLGLPKIANFWQIRDFRYFCFWAPRGQNLAQDAPGWPGTAPQGVLRLARTPCEWPGLILRPTNWSGALFSAKSLACQKLPIFGRFRPPKILPFWWILLENRSRNDDIHFAKCPDLVCSVPTMSRDVAETTERIPGP